MNWREFWDQRANLELSPYEQVARTGGKARIDDFLLQQIADWIADHLQLSQDEHLLDVCCGNGMLTSRLALRCKQVTGVDLSPAQIQLASTYHSDFNISYQVGDATTLSVLASHQFDKINLYFSFQYLDTYAKGKAAIQAMLHTLKPGGKIFIGDVPDYQYLERYFPSFSARLKYKLRFLKGGHEMGKFWKASEIRRIVEAEGAKLHYIPQPDQFPYAHYQGRLSD